MESSNISLSAKVRVEQLQESDFVDFWVRVLISLIDGAILLGPAYLLNRWSVSLADSLQSEIPIIIPWLMGIAFYVFLIPRFGGTPGRLIMRTRIINTKGNYPTLTQALLRYGLYIINIIFSVLLDISKYDFTLLSTYAFRWADQVSFLSFLMSCVLIIDGLFIIFTIRNRAIHDMIAGTYVVYKSGLEYAEAINQKQND